MQTAKDLIHNKTLENIWGLCLQAKISLCFSDASLFTGLTYMCLWVGLGSLVSVPQSTRQKALSHPLLMAAHLSHNNTAAAHRLADIWCVTCYCLKGNPHLQQALWDLYYSVTCPCTLRAAHSPPALIALAQTFIKEETFLVNLSSDLCHNAVKWPV